MNIVVYCGSSAGDNPHIEQAARDLGAWIAQSGNALVYGGSSVGLMGIVAGTALAGGAHVVGVEPRFFIEAGVAQHDLPELVVTETMSQRKAKMIALGDAFVALPGGTGTLEEISEIMSRLRLRMTDAPCLCLNIDGFYDLLAAQIDLMVQHGFLDAQTRAAIAFPTTVDEAVALLDGGK